MDKNKQAEDELYNIFISEWKTSVFLSIFFLVIGSGITMIVLLLLRFEQMSIPTILINSTTIIPQGLSFMSNATLTLNGLMLGFASVCIFNLLSWSDNKIYQEYDHAVRTDILIVRKAFSRFSLKYFESAVTCLLAQLVSVMIKVASDFLGLLTLFLDLVITIIILQGFLIIMRIVLKRIEFEQFSDFES